LYNVQWTHSKDHPARLYDKNNSSEEGYAAFDLSLRFHIETASHNAAPTVHTLVLTVTNVNSVDKPTGMYAFK